MAITDLTGTKWYFKDSPNWSGIPYTSVVSGTVNYLPLNFSGFGNHTGIGYYNYTYPAPGAYIDNGSAFVVWKSGDGWNHSSYRTITITGGYGATSSSFISWLQSNATQIFTVSFNANGHGSAPFPQEIQSGQKATRPTDPTATGYIFGGWYTEQACTNLFDFNTAITSDRTLYAKWTQATPTYTVTFNANGHGTAPSSQTVEEGQKATKPTDPTATGYRFDGWFTEQACTNEFDFNTPITANRTLWAKWTAAYNVTFNMHGHGTQVPQQAVVSGDTAERPPDPSAQGYRFDGWYTESTYTNLFDFDTPITSNITLHAKWTQVITYSVTYSTQFGSVPTKYKEQGTTLTSDDLPLLDHEGYRFGGWYLDETYHTPALGKEMTENITVYAKWTEITAQLPLYIGNDLITKIFIGTDEISSIFIGNERVY